MYMNMVVKHTFHEFTCRWFLWLCCFVSGALYRLWSDCPCNLFTYCMHLLWKGLHRRWLKEVIFTLLCFACEVIKMKRKDKAALTSKCWLSESLVSAPVWAALQTCQRFLWESPAQTQKHWFDTRQQRKHWKCITTCKSFLLSITHFFWRRSYPRALQVESDAAQRPLMGRYVHWRLLCVGQVHDLHVAWMSPGKRQQRVVTVRTQHTQTWGGRGRRLLYTHSNPRRWVNRAHWPLGL